MMPIWISAHEKFSLVEQLAINLLGEQPIYFQMSADDHEICKRLERVRSTLMAFFKDNSTQEDR